MAVTCIVSLQHSIVTDAQPNGVSLQLNNTGSALTIKQIVQSNLQPLTRFSGMQNLVGQNVPAGASVLTYVESYGSPGMPVPSNDIHNSQLVGPLAIQFSDGSTATYPNGLPTVTVVPPFVRQAVNGSPFGANLAIPGPGQMCFDSNDNSYTMGVSAMGLN